MAEQIEDEALPPMNPLPSMKLSQFRRGERAVSELACRNYARLYAKAAMLSITNTARQKPTGKKEMKRAIRLLLRAVRETPGAMTTLGRLALEDGNYDLLALAFAASDQ